MDLRYIVLLLLYMFFVISPEEFERRLNVLYECKEEEPDVSNLDTSECPRCAKCGELAEEFDGIDWLCLRHADM